MALRFTQFLTVMSTDDLLGGKGGRCVGLTTLPPLYAAGINIQELYGRIWACTEIYLYLPVYNVSTHQIAYSWSLGHKTVD